MIIGFDAKRAFNNTTGLGNYSRTLITGLESIAPFNHYVLFTPGIKKKETISEFKTATKAKIVNHNDPLSSVWRSFGISADIDSEQIDIYHGLSNELPFSINRTSCAKIVTIHDLIYQILPDTYNWGDRLIYDKKFKFACNHADVVIAVSESTKQDVVDQFHIPEEKVKVIYQSCDPLFFQNTKGEDPSVLEKYGIPNEYLLYVGSVIPRKNLKTVCKALLALNPSLQVPIVVVGSGGGYFEEVKNMMYKAGKPELMIWLNNLQSTSDLKKIYQMAKLFLYPSIYEGFGIPVLEALLSEVPVITSNVSSLPEAVGPGGIMVDPYDVDELKVAIETVLTDDVLQSELIKKGSQHARNFTSKKLSSQLLELYRTLY
jgi:glycosyltransferase involved in cell wall biosynthesis